MTHETDATIPIAGRFQRIENVLNRIEEKLDLKANISEVSRLDARVVALENGTSPYNERLIRDFFNAQQNISSLQLENSKNLPIMAMIPDLDARLTAVESAVNSNLAVQQAVNASKDNGIKLRYILVGLIISGISSAGALTIGIITLLRHI